MRVGELKLGDVGKTVTATKNNNQLHGVLSDIRVAPDGMSVSFWEPTDYTFTVTVGGIVLRDAHWWEFDVSE